MTRLMHLDFSVHLSLDLKILWERPVEDVWFPTVAYSFLGNYNYLFRSAPSPASPVLRHMADRMLMRPETALVHVSFSVRSLNTMLPPHILPLVVDAWWFWSVPHVPYPAGGWILPGRL